MSESLQQPLDSLARDECYRVDAVLKEGPYERTERVFFVGANGAEQGPYVRKVFEAESGLGGAYGRVLAAQRQGKRFLHLPRIVDCYSLGEQDAVVMEFVPGRTLADKIYETGLSLDVAKRLFPGICDAIAELHSRFDPSFIHRDIKPSNFMVDGDTVLVIDLGIARTFDKDAVCDTSHTGLSDPRSSSGRLWRRVWWAPHSSCSRSSVSCFCENPSICYCYTTIFWKIGAVYRMGLHQITVRVQSLKKSRGDGWVLVGPAAFKAVVRRAERLGCVRFARVSAI